MLKYNWLIIYFTLVASLNVFSIFGASHNTLEIGAHAPDFHLPGVDGKSYTLQHFDANKTLVILFTCSKCPVNKAYTERFFSLATECKDKDIAFVAISTSWDEEHTAQLALNSNPNLVCLLDFKHSPVTESYAPTVVPLVFVFDKNRQLCYKGSIDDAEKAENIQHHYLQEALTQLEKNEMPLIKETVVVGCEFKKQPDTLYHHTSVIHQEGDILIGKINTHQLKSLLSGHNTAHHKLIYFWTAKCHLCNFELSDLVHTAKYLKSMNIDVVTVNLDGLKKHKKTKKALYNGNCSGKHLIYEETQSDTENNDIYTMFNDKWGESIPHVIMIAPGGEIIFSDVNVISQKELKHKIVTLIKNKRHDTHPVSSLH